MAIQIPDKLKAHLPPTPYGKILGATPVVMTVVATILAGLSSSEMTTAQYDRSLAAQLQSKAGDQWGLFQAKRLRGALQRSTLDLLNNTSELHSLDADTLLRRTDPSATETDDSPAAQWKADMISLLTSSEGQRAVIVLQKGELSSILPPAPALDPRVKDSLEAIEDLRPEREIALVLARLDSASLDKALQAVQERIKSFDKTMAPAEQAINRLETLLAKRPSPKTSAAAASDSTNRDFKAHRLRYSAARYDTEAQLNQAVATVYELQVRKSNASAERHHVRSQRFFYGMLSGQMAVVIATLAIAARQRNLLWSIAAVAGIGAISFAAYVYFNV